MQYPLSVFGNMKIYRVLWMCFFLLVCRLSCLAQFSPIFDSSLRAAMAVTDPVKRLDKLRSIKTDAEASSVFQSISFGKEFLLAASEVRSDTDRYYAHLILGMGYERNRDYEQSVKHCLEAIDIADARKDYTNQIRAFQSLAFTYSSMGMMSNDTADIEKAFHYCNQAMEISKEHNVKSEEPYIFTLMGDVNAMNKRYDTAIALYRHAISSRKAQGLGGMMTTYMNLGIALNLNKDYTGALEAYATADSITTAMHTGTFFKTKIASNRAILYGDIGRNEESERLAKEVLASAQKTGALDIQVDMVDHLKNLYRKEGRYQEALVLADTLAAIKEQMLTAEKTGQVAEMEARYDAGVKDQQIVGQQNTIRQSKRQSMVLWGGIALLFMVGSAAFYGWKRSRQLNREITDQRQQLIMQKTELQRINETKDQLFGLISHDVRVPLNSLIAYATLLDQQGQLPPEKIKKYNTDLRQTLGYTTVLMENLLQFAKTQMQATKAYPEIISLSTVVNRAVRLLQPAMDQKNILLETDFEEDTTAFADEDMTDVILRNLLSNAIKFSNAGERITISIKPYDEVHICCTIQDHGAGMKRELIALWNDTSVPAPLRSKMGTQHEKGAGLGLMLSKTFAMLMGVRLSVKSEEGKGAAFSLLLPKRNPAI